MRDEGLEAAKVYLLCSRDDEARGIRGSCRLCGEVRYGILEVTRVNLGLGLGKEDVGEVEVEQEDVRSVYEAVRRIYEGLPGSTRSA